MKIMFQWDLSSGTPFNFTFNSTVIGGNSNYDGTSTDVIYYVFRAVDGYSKFGSYIALRSSNYLHQTMMASLFIWIWT